MIASTIPVVAAPSLAGLLVFAALLEEGLGRRWRLGCRTRPRTGDGRGVFGFGVARPQRAGTQRQTAARSEVWMALNVKVVTPSGSLPAMIVK